MRLRKKHKKEIKKKNKIKNFYKGVFHKNVLIEKMSTERYGMRIKRNGMLLIRCAPIYNGTKAHYWYDNYVGSTFKIIEEMDTVFAVLDKDGFRKDVRKTHCEVIK